jgi:hypothetical protein
MRARPSHAGPQWQRKGYDAGIPADFSHLAGEQRIHEYGDCSGSPAITRTLNLVVKHPPFLCHTQIFTLRYSLVFL